MAGGYKPPRTGTDGIAAKFADIYRRLDALAAAAGIRSSVVKSVDLRFQDDDGQNIVQIGTFAQPYFVSGEPAGTRMVRGIVAYDDNDEPILTAVQFEDDDSTMVKVGSADTIFADDADQLDKLRLYAKDVYVHGTDITEIHSEETLWLTSDAFDVRLAWSSSGSAANVYLDPADGRIYRSTSSSRYKTDIADAEIDPDDVLKMRPRTWVDKAAIDRDEPGDIRRHIGLVAEELDELPSLRQFINYDSEGKPDSIEEPRLPVALLALAKAQQAQIDQLTRRLEALEGK